MGVVMVRVQVVMMTMMMMMMMMMLMLMMLFFFFSFSFQKPKKQYKYRPKNQVNKYRERKLDKLGNSVGQSVVRVSDRKMRDPNKTLQKLPEL